MYHVTLERLSDGAEIRIATVALAQICGLRTRVLRPGTPSGSLLFLPGDSQETTFHIGAFPKRNECSFSGKPVCCATFILTDRVEGTPLYQLRGMATDPAWQRRGLGGRVLSWFEGAVLRERMRRTLSTSSVHLWCSARIPAIPFYEKLGWRASGAVFDIPGAGEHRRMDKHVLVTG